jgi:drug/metabolite transporter (DMT)-like permease
MLKTILLTVLALFAFAGNSVLCRLALNDDVIDAASFSSIRLFSGAIFLLLLVTISAKGNVNFKRGSWSSSCYLFLYALAFSYAYVSLDTGVGALILFGAVQVTMIVSGLRTGKSLLSVEWAGLFVAFLGLLVLLMPGAAAPPLTGFVLMAISGIAWGFYSLAGKRSTTPLLDTASNFLRTLPLVALLICFTFDHVQISNQGVALAIASGCIMSGLGYAIWYAALSGLTVTQAAIIQLTVPIIAAVGGVLLSNEVITIKLFISSILVLGGVLLVIVGKHYVGQLAKSKA